MTSQQSRPWHSQRKFWYHCGMKSISIDVLRQLVQHAAISPRGRINHNLHPTLDDPIQRFFNWMEPGSYVRPHRHTDPPRWEAFLALAGRAVILVFTDDGTISARTEISPAGPDVAVEIPGGGWHTVTATASGTTLFELKPGPYSQISDKDFARWAPPEGDPGTDQFTRWFSTAKPGDVPPRWDPSP